MSNTLTLPASNTFAVEGGSNETGVILHCNMTCTLDTFDQYTGDIGSRGLYKIYHKTGTAAGDVVDSGASGSNPTTSGVTLTAGEDYFLVVYRGASTYDLYKQDTASYPYTGTDINCIGRVRMGDTEGTDEVWNIKEIITTTTPASPTILPSTLTLSTTAEAPAISISKMVPIATPLALTLSLVPETFQVWDYRELNPNRGTKSTAAIATITAEADIGQVLSNVPGSSTVLSKKRVGLELNG